MTTQVYYQKWRPSTFAELVGQEHVAATIKQAAKQQRISHSYLLCGPRGSGKTTTARIIAKIVNCLDLQDGDACNTCTICQSINQGRFMDIIELDAASNRGIDEIRDIRDKVNFSPVQGRRKVYIIDEAHMLTDAASNAFLKTLEEPPGHVVFVLCTTEAQKILPTIISRCQRFDFRRISSDLINSRLLEITDTEGVNADPEALRLVARHAGGSLRDAENLLEQLAVASQNSITVSQVEAMLGLGHGEQELQLVSCLISGNTSSALDAINQAAWDGIDPRQLHRQTLELLRAAMLSQWQNNDSAGGLDLAEQTLSHIRELTTQVPRNRIVTALKIWGDLNMRHDAPSTLPLEIAAVEICNQEELYHRTPAPPQEQPLAHPPAARHRQAANGAQPVPQSQPPAPTPAPAAQKPTTVTRWSAIVRTLSGQKGNKYNLGALLRDCNPDDISTDDNILILPFNNRSHMERMQQEIDHQPTKAKILEAIREHFGTDYNIQLTVQADPDTTTFARNVAGNPDSPQAVVFLTSIVDVTVGV